MAPYDLRIVISPSVKVFPVVPGREAPNRGKATAINPHRRIIGRIPRSREKCWNHLIERLRRGRSRLRDSDAIRRIGELEIVHGGGADGLAQAGHYYSPWRAPALLDLGSPGIRPPPGIAHGRRSIRPGVIRIVRHQR